LPKACLIVPLRDQKFEPLLLLPIGFGAILANIPGAGIAEGNGILHIFYEVGIESGAFPLPMAAASFRLKSKIPMALKPMAPNKVAKIPNCAAAPSNKV
jgi:hypothetical protein